MLTIALAGNPNSGKTTVFNAITGSRQHVGNYPGVTVEKKEGSARWDGVKLNVVDLPGTYSLTAYSIEEIVARNVLIDESPDVVVDIIDSSNLERNLYLATQILELGVPLVLAFNMSDLAVGRGLSIDTQKLSGLLGVPIVPTVGHKKKGIRELLQAAVEVARDPSDALERQRHPGYGNEVEPHVRDLTARLVEACKLDGHQRWYAVKLLENDEETIKRLRGFCGGEGLESVLGRAHHLRAHLERVCGDPPEIILADRRYGFISGACTEATTLTVEARHNTSDKIDAVLTNRWLGLPIFAMLMYLVFQLTFTIASPCVDFLDGLINGDLSLWVRHIWPAGSDSLLRSLIVDGVIGGVGAVLVFTPLILLLFLAIAILEDTGYMARAAFIMDRLMHKIGLHGKSFVPMLIGFGCSVPAIMATRMLENRRDRLTTMLVVPLMSCGARLPIYALIIPAFFPKKTLFSIFGIGFTNQGGLLFLIYVIGIVLAIFCAKLLRATLLRGEKAPFVMELPPYRTPTIRGLLIHMWTRTWLYVKRAGTVIFALAIILWVMDTLPRNKELAKDYDQRIANLTETYEQSVSAADADHEIIKTSYEEKIGELKAQEREKQLEYSISGRLGHTIEPILRPMGFDWRIGVALIGAFGAKEVFVSQMGIVYALGDEQTEKSEPLQDKIARDYTPLQGFCIMLFCLTSAPCLATIAVTRRESNSWGWALFQLAGLTALAWVLTTVVYQIGRLLV